MPPETNTSERTGEGFGEPPPGHGYEAFTDEALEIDGASPQQEQAHPATAEPDVENLDTVGDDAYRGTEDGDQETPAQEAARKLAGRYNTVEDLEAGYKNIQRLQTRESQARREAELRAAQLQAQLEAFTRAPAQQPQADSDPYAIYDPNNLQQLVDQRVLQRTAQVQEAMAAQQQATEVAQAIDDFRSAHPDVQPETPLDIAMSQVILEFQTDPETGRLDGELFPVTRENLEVAHTLTTNERLLEAVRDLDLIPTPENIQIANEALTNPALYETLVSQPELLDTDQGLNHARRLANLPGFYEAAQQSARPPSAQDMQRAAFVETGGTGAPVGGPPGRRPADEMDEAILRYRQGRDESVFTGWRPSQ